MSSNEYMAEYMNRRYHERRAALIKELGGKCEQCGSTEDLELDHVDRKTKKHDIGKLLSRGETRYREEARLCQLLCKNCHKFKSGAEQSVEHGGGLTGKKNCLCDLCRPLKNAYMREWKRKKRAPVAQRTELITLNN